MLHKPDDVINQSFQFSPSLKALGLPLNSLWGKGLGEVCLEFSKIAASHNIMTSALHGTFCS